MDVLDKNKDNVLSIHNLSFNGVITTENYPVDYIEAIRPYLEEYKKKRGYVFGIHMDAEGTETFFCHGSANGRQLAECIQDQLVDSMGTADRGVKAAVPGKNGLYVLTNTDMPAVLVELAFISNEDEEKMLRNRQEDFARAIACGVTDYL